MDEPPLRRALWTMDAREGGAAATHVGAGVAQRAAYHARVRAAAAEAEARCATGEVLQHEASADVDSFTPTHNPLANTHTCCAALLCAACPGALLCF